MRVKVVKTLNARVRSGPGTNYELKGTQPQGSLGTVSEPGQPGNGYWWLLVDFDSGVDGWVTQGNLQEVEEPPPDLPPDLPTMTLNVVGNGAVGGAGDYAFGLMATIEAIPATGNHFVGWTGDVVSDHPVEQVLMDDEKAATATFAVDVAVPLPPQPGGPTANGTWSRLLQPVGPVDQPRLTGQWGSTTNPPGTDAPHTIQADFAIFRTYSGFKFGRLVGMYYGGGHASHPSGEPALLVKATGRVQYPYGAECPDPTDPIWRGIKGGGILTGGFSPRGKPWTEHSYNNVRWDSRRMRFLVIYGNGLMGYAPPFSGHPEGEWELVVGTDRYANEVIFGSGGGFEYDHPLDAAFLFATYSGNGATRGVYRYQFNSAGAVVSKTRVNFPTIPSGQTWSWAYRTMIAINDEPRRRIRVMAVPASGSASGDPFYRLWDFFPDTGAWLWDSTLVPGTPAYDEVFASGSTQGKVFEVRRATGETFVYSRNNSRIGWWIQNLDGKWRFLATPGGPGIAGFTLSADIDGDCFVGVNNRNNQLYCGQAGSSCGGPADFWKFVPS